MTTTIEPGRGELSPSEVVPFRRIVAFETPSADALLARLTKLWPGTTFMLQPDLRLVGPPEPAIVPVFFVTGDEADLALTAGERLRTFFFPLVAGGQPYCLAFQVGRDSLTARPLDVTTVGVLELETVGALLREDAVFENFGVLGALPDRLTPRVARSNRVHATPSAHRRECLACRLGNGPSPYSTGTPTR